MSKHTPAPWPILLHSCAPDKIFSIGPIEAYFEMVDGEVLPFLDVPEEDARLIAAAPRLLASLKQARLELHACQAVIHLAGGFDPAYVDGAQKALKAVDAAIDEAEGRNE
jgi:hypothetical protein